MTDRRNGESGDHPVPRDMPDQQAQGTSDPWEVTAEDAERASERGRESRGTSGRGARRASSESGDAHAAAGNAADVPDTDEAGAGRRDAPGRRTGSPDPEHPAPEESPD